MTGRPAYDEPYDDIHGEIEDDAHRLDVAGLRIETSWDDPMAFRDYWLPRRRRTGFTLVEILLVCAVLLVLMAILLPSFAGARERARLAVCAANMGQMGKATQDYMCDSWQQFPTIGGYESIYNHESLICPNDANPFVLTRQMSGSDIDLPMSVGINTEFYVWRLNHGRVGPAADIAVNFDGIPALGADYVTTETFESAFDWSKGMAKVDILHRPPGNPDNLRPITIAVTALPAHIRHGCQFGAFDTNRTDVGANVAQFFIPRHPVTYDVGNVLFADWHVEYVPRLEDRNLLFPGGGHISTTITKTPPVIPNSGPKN